MSEGTRENKRLDTTGSGCCEHDRSRTALADTHQRGAVESGRVHDRFDLSRSILDRAYFGHWIRQADSRLVENQYSTKRTELVEPSLRFRDRPRQLDVTDERRRDH